MTTIEHQDSRKAPTGDRGPADRMDDWMRQEHLWEERNRREVRRTVRRRKETAFNWQASQNDGKIQVMECNHPRKKRIVALPQIRYEYIHGHRSQARRVLQRYFSGPSWPRISDRPHLGLPPWRPQPRRKTRRRTITAIWVWINSPGGSWDPKRSKIGVEELRSLISVWPSTTF